MKVEQHAGISFERVLLILAGIIAALTALAVEANAQQQTQFIYGKVHTSGNVYQGVLRWGTEEILWTDHFNASKAGNTYQKPESESDGWLDIDWRFSSIWENKSTIFQFTTQFGDLKQLTVVRGGVDATLKNGAKIRLSGSGYNDIGTVVKVYDEELGAINVSWDKIQKIEFMQAPASTQFKEVPLYGTVETTRKGNFTGFIVWDKDERIGSDKLDGETRDGNVSIRFSEIKKIYRTSKGSDVTLQSGRELFVQGSNDVNDGNRGIIVVVEGVGAVEIPWSAFRGVIFTRPPTSGYSYSSFETPKMLSGEVVTFNDKKISGNMVYDRDETWPLEMLEGNDDEIKYTIPFRNIRSIKPKNYNYSVVELRNGEKLLIGGARDVSADNDGILIFHAGKKEPEHISWTKISEINFN